VPRSLGRSDHVAARFREHGAQVVRRRTGGHKEADAAVGQKLLYTRADFVRSGHEFRVMELELVEPSMYLRIDAGAPDRFADAIASRLA